MLTVFLVLVLLLAVSVVGQESNFKNFFGANQKKFRVDYAAFASDEEPGKVRLEIFYQFYNSILTFDHVGVNYEAEYELKVVVFDKHKNRVASAERIRTVTVNSQSRAVSTSEFRANQFDFELKPDKYKVELTLNDLNGDNVYREQLKIKLKDFRRRLPTMSDIEMVMAIGSLTNDSSVFAKGDFSVVPGLTREYRAGDDDKMFFYFEVYPGEDSDSRAVVVVTIRQPFRSMVYRDSLHVDFGEPVSRQLRQVSTKGYLPGDYILEISLLGRRDKRLDHRKEEFTIKYSHEAMLVRDFKAATQQLRYIAESREMDAFKDVETLEDRQRVFDDFWASKDPTPGSAENEFKNEFYRRVGVSNKNFGYMRTAGWRTDRGRIYIVFGEPDQIDDYPLVIETRPYQEWHYYHGGRYRRFMFVDESEDGDYRLRYPYDGLDIRPEF